MERTKAVIASAIVAATVMGDAVAYAATSGITNSRSDNVGQLQPAGVQPVTITVVVDPVTGTVTVPAPQPAAVAQPAASPSTAKSRRERENEREDGDD